MTAPHWDDRYDRVGETSVSWFQEDPRPSLELIERVADAQASIVDVGGGASRLVDRLLERGHRDLTVVDLSRRALNLARRRVGDAPVAWVVADVREWQPDRGFDVWHDRAAYHFLTDPHDQRQYWDLMRECVPHGGHVVIATFADDGPATRSGLPVVRHTESALAEAMGDGIAVVETRREQHVTPTGGMQDFVWVLAQRT